MFHIMYLDYQHGKIRVVKVKGFFVLFYSIALKLFCFHCFKSALSFVNQFLDINSPEIVQNADQTI